MKRPTLFGLLAALMALQAGLLAYSARVHSPTWDEPAHLAAGLSHWKFGRFDLYSVNPPLVRTLAAAPVALFAKPEMDWGLYRSDPVMRSEILLGRRMIELNGEKSFDHMFIARLTLIPLVMSGTVLCFLWGRMLFGQASGLAAACMWVFSPMVLGFGSVVTPDVGSAVVMLAASLVFWRWLKSPSWSWAVAVAVALAVAMLTKSVWLVLPAVFLLIWGVYCWGTFRHGRRSSATSTPHAVSPRVQAAMLTSATVAALLLVNVFYGFSGSLRQLGKFEFVSAAFAGAPDPDCEDCGEQRGNRFAGTLVSSIPVPIPAPYLQGIDIQLHDFERGRHDPGWKSYLWGEWKQGGWWYFYIIGLLAKEPLVFWLLVGAGSLAACFRRPGAGVSWGLACLGGPALVLLCLASANTGMTLHVRYVIPVLPVLMVWASQVVHLRWPSRASLAHADSVNKSRLAATTLILRRHLGTTVAGIGCAVLAVVALSVGPHWLSHFSIIAGGNKHGHQMLADSNVDWGQDLRFLKLWLQSHPEAASDLHLAYFGSYDPAAVGIDYRMPPPLLRSKPGPFHTAQQRHAGPQPGWHAVSVNYLRGHNRSVPNGRGSYRYFDSPVFEYFTDFTPIDRAGRSIYIYHLSTSDVEKARAKRALPRLDIASDNAKQIASR